MLLESQQGTVRQRLADFGIRNKLQHMIEEIRGSSRMTTRSCAESRRRATVANWEARSQNPR